MWSVWLVFCDCVLLRIRGLWKLPDERDWLRGKLGFVLMGRAMLSKSLIQFSVDGWGCVPSLLFDLRPNYGGGNEDNGNLLQKVPCRHCYTQRPRSCSRPPPTHTSAGDSNTLATWCEELTHWKRPSSRERLKAGGEGDDRGWDGWTASTTRWTWVWAISRSWWWTGKPCVLQSLGSQRVRHNWVTELTGKGKYLIVFLLILVLKWRPKNTNSRTSLVVQWLGLCLPSRGCRFHPWSEH